MMPVTPAFSLVGAPENEAEALPLVAEANETVVAALTA
jgi:hypothetical protein